VSININQSARVSIIPVSMNKGGTRNLKVGWSMNWKVGGGVNITNTQNFEKVWVTDPPPPAFMVASPLSININQSARVNYITVYKHQPISSCLLYQCPQTSTNQLVWCLSQLIHCLQHQPIRLSVSLCFVIQFKKNELLSQIIKNVN